MPHIYTNSSIRLTDELERQLMLQAIEEQCRPRPLRALARGLRQVGKVVKTVIGRRVDATSAHSAA